VRVAGPQTVGPDHIGKLDADALAVQLLDDSVYTNPLMLGYAWQRGKVPLSLAALMRAIELNGVQVENNKAAFEWGRRAAAEPKEVKALVRTGQVIELVKRSTNLDDMIAKRVEFLTDYQNAAYAEQYKRFVDTVRAKEADLVFSRTATRPDATRPSTKLTEAVARYLFKLMAYKDEYEVARLHATGVSSTRSRRSSKARWARTSSSPITSRRRRSRVATTKASCRRRSSGRGCCRRFAPSPSSRSCAAPPSIRSAAPRSGVPSGP
jgi:predicted O-linked N-acetylglucosamine transferase (SPINDLY family)